MISVIVPALNEEENIEACLRSVLDQSLDEEFEIVVVDGGSRDGTAEIAQRLADKVITQTSPGIGGARRDGAKAAKGDKLAFTDADTIVSEGWLKAASSNLDRFSASTGPVIYANADLKSELLQKWRYLYRLLAISNFYYILGSNMAVRAEVYSRIGGHSDISLLDDYDLSLRLCKAGAKVRYDRDQIVYTSSRRATRLLTYTIVVAYGHYHYRISGDHSKLLRYPSPDEMTLRSLLPEKGLRPSLEASLEAAQSSLHSRIKRMI